MSKDTAYTLEARKLHKLPNIDSYTNDQLLEIANYLSSYTSRHISLDAKSRTVLITDHKAGTRLSVSRWLHMTLMHQRKSAGKMTYESGTKNPLGVYSYPEIVRLGGRGQPKYRQLVSKWILQDLYPRATRRPFFVDGDRHNLVEANIIPWPSGSLLPGLRRYATVFPVRKFWDCTDYVTDQTIQGEDEAGLYEFLAGEKVTLKPKKKVTGEDTIDTESEWWKLVERAKALDAIHGTERGVYGWFTEDGRRENGLRAIN